MRALRCRRSLRATRRQVQPAALPRYRLLVRSGCPCPGHLAAGLAAIGLAATLASYGNTGGGVTAMSPASPPTSAVMTVVPVASPPPPAAPRPGALRPGDRGPGVLDLQRQLAAAGYWLGPVDGIYGLLTQQAVFAVQKTAGIGVDGLAGPATAAALRDGARPRASSTRGRVLEVDLGRQLFLVVRDGTVEWVFNTSTGSGQWYEVDGQRRLAVTPKGNWRIFREVNGVDHGPLGDLYRPKYFTGGIAVHGYSSVPPRPVSHGCVRVTNAAMDWLWSSGVAPVRTAVLVR